MRRQMLTPAALRIGSLRKAAAALGVNRVGIRPHAGEPQQRRAWPGRLSVVPTPDRAGLWGQRVMLGLGVQSGAAWSARRDNRRQICSRQSGNAFLRPQRSSDKSGVGQIVQDAGHAFGDESVRRQGWQPMFSADPRRGWSVLNDLARQRAQLEKGTAAFLRLGFGAGRWLAVSSTSPAGVSVTEVAGSTVRWDTGSNRCSARTRQSSISSRVGRASTGGKMSITCGRRADMARLVGLRVDGVPHREQPMAKLGCVDVLAGLDHTGQRRRFSVCCQKAAGSTRWTSASPVVTTSVCGAVPLRPRRASTATRDPMTSAEGDERS